jgi:hypothetical protein
MSYIFFWFVYLIERSESITRTSYTEVRHKSEGFFEDYKNKVNTNNLN